MNCHPIKFLGIILLIYTSPVFSQLPAEYSITWNEGVMYWEKKPADYDKAFAKLSRADQLGNKFLIVNPFKSYDELKSRAAELKDGNRRFVRFLINMHQNRPDLDKKYDPLTLAWHITERLKSYNFRYEILKSLVNALPENKKNTLRRLFTSLESADPVQAGTIELSINDLIPDYKLLSHQAISLNEIKSVLQPGEILLSFLMGDNGRNVYVWKIQKDFRPEVISLGLNTADLFFRIECLRADFQENKAYKDSILNLYLPFEKHNPLDHYGPSPPFTRAGYTIKENLKVLSEAVIAPLKLLAGSKLIIAADQNISALPFDILTLNGKPLMNYFDVSYIPSARVFYFLRTTHPDLPRPAFSSFCGFSFDDGGKIPEMEVDAFNGENKKVIHNAKETDIYRNVGYIETSNIVHFSTHGKLTENINNTRTQYLQYYSDIDNDGKLTSSEIARKLKFHQNLVVLSACQTAPSLDNNDYFQSAGCLCSYGETLSNLTSAFFVAGSRYIIMTQWDVKSRESNDFFEIFYEKLNEYKEVEKALKETKKDLLNDNNFALYAPFILVCY